MVDPSSQEAPLDTAESSRAEEVLGEAIRRLRRVEPRAFLVEPRVLRRVIKAEVDLPALTVQVPHRKTWLVKRNTLIKYVELDELGAEPMAELPEPAILLQRPDERALATMELEALLARTWRLLFHARIDLAFQQMREAGWLNQAKIRERVHRLGQAEFDEVCEVLRHENMIWEDTTVPGMYSEFAAVYGELRAFAPHCLPAYFPSLQGAKKVDELLLEDVDLNQLLAETRPEGAPDPISEEDRAAHDETDAELEHLTGHSPRSGLHPEQAAEVKLEVPPADKRNPALVRRQQKRAERAASRGNSVAAALFLVGAARHSAPEEAAALQEGAEAHLRRLVERLQAALGFDTEAGERWYGTVVGLARNAGRGFWNADKRLLHDLQRVCVDHEKETSKIDLLRWARGLFRSELKRALPNMREVLMSKHLASAARRLVSSRLTGPERDDLSHLLGEAAESAELQMRTRLRPRIQSTLVEVGLIASTNPEKVAFDKAIEELLDQVVAGGYLNIGHLRDAVSRSHLKLDDVSGPQGVLPGRPLAEGRPLPRAVPRWRLPAQRLLPSLAPARDLAGFRHAARALPDPLRLPAVRQRLPALRGAAAPRRDDGRRGFDDHALAGGAHAPNRGCPGRHRALALPRRGFPHGGLGALKGLFTGLRKVLYDWPLQLFRWPYVRSLLRSGPVVILRKLVLWPLVPTALICGLLPRFVDSMPTQTTINWGIVLIAMSVILNSRVGRDVEELGQEWLYSMWRRFRVNVLVALFDAIMGSFKRMLELFERLLYAVDEWLRFKSGETLVSLGVKAVLGLFWNVFTFVARFVVNLLIEPQVNPIKHFPVVTVSHKLLLPLAPTLITFLEGFDAFTRDEATAVVGPTVFLIPGVFGFIAWELRSNWQLYKENRSRELRPVLVGSHGESFIRLMKPGFHSGTMPKLFRKLRRIDRRRRAAEHSLTRSRTLAKLHHVHQAVDRFVERELVSLLDKLPAWRHDVRAGRVRLASNSVRINLECSELAGPSMQLLFEEQSGWLLACVPRPGWASELTAEDASLLGDALSGFYRLAGVDLIREQIDVALGGDGMPYDINEEGMTVWPDRAYKDEAAYNLHRKASLRPSPRSVARAYELPALGREQLVFSHTPIQREAWEGRWTGAGNEATPLLPAAARWTWVSGPESARASSASFRAS